MRNLEADPVAEVRHVSLGEVHRRILTQVVSVLERKHAAVAPVLLPRDVSGRHILPVGEVVLIATAIFRLVRYTLLRLTVSVRHVPSEILQASGVAATERVIVLEPLLHEIDACHTPVVLTDVDRDE